MHRRVESQTIYVKSLSNFGFCFGHCLQQLNITLSRRTMEANWKDCFHAKHTINVISIIIIVFIGPHIWNWNDHVVYVHYDAELLVNLDVRDFVEIDVCICIRVGSEEEMAYGSFINSQHTLTICREIFWTRVREGSKTKVADHILGNLSIMFFYLLWNYIVWYCFLALLFLWWAYNDLLVFFHLSFRFAWTIIVLIWFGFRISEGVSFLSKECCFMIFAWKMKLWQSNICMLCRCVTLDAFECLYVIKRNIM